MSKILITTSSFDLSHFKEIEVIKNSGFEIKLNPYGKRLTESQISELIDDEVVGIIAGLEPLTEQVLRRGKNLKVISRCGIGLDNVDLKIAQELDISVHNTPDAPTRAVAELTLSHILSLCRRLVESDRSIKAGEWSPLMGSLLSEQTVGIIGFGRIGRMVAKLLSSFGAKILVHDDYITAESDVSLVSLKELLAQSDIISLHIPYNSENHHLVDSNFLSGMKKGALIVNIARGGLIDENALAAALQSQHIGGAALDCFEIEPYSGPLTGFSNVQLTAHMGSYAKESRSMQESEACDELMKGMRLKGLIN